MRNKLHDLIFDGMVKYVEAGELSVHVDAEAFADFLIAHGVCIVPEGKPGDFIEWDNGVGYKSFHQIKAVTLERDGNFRYLTENIQPIVNHKGIVRVISAEEMDRMMGR